MTIDQGAGAAHDFAASVDQDDLHIGGRPLFLIEHFADHFGGAVFERDDAFAYLACKIEHAVAFARFDAGHLDRLHVVALRQAAGLNPVAQGVERGDSKAALPIHPGAGTARETSLGLEPEAERVQRPSFVRADPPRKRDGGLESNGESADVATGNVEIEVSRKPLLILTRQAGGTQDVGSRRNAV